MTTLTQEEKNKLQTMTAGDKQFHYMLTDRVRQDITYHTTRTQNKEKATYLLNKIEFLLSLFQEKDLPEWYTLADLNRDRKLVSTL